MSEICILYCLHKREMTIYSVKKFIAEWFGTYTRPSHGTIHPSLKKLLAENFVSVREILSDGGRKSSFYSITEKGKRYFAELMLENFSDNPTVFMNEIALRISALGALSKDNRKILTEKGLKTADLSVIMIDRKLNDEYSGLDDFQKSMMNQTKKQILSLTEFLKSLEV